MKVFILGCGLYGCHAAMTLKAHNIDFVMADLTNNFFEGSSSKNQNRLHLGFHYPRSYKTRQECKKGYVDFMERYGHVTEEIENNIYLIDQSSIIDFDTYKNIYSFENISYTTNILPNAIPFEYNNNMFQGLIKTEERYINFEKCKIFFQTQLRPFLIEQYNPQDLIITKDKIFYKDQEFDLLLDCTYFQALTPYPIAQVMDIEYELCISFLYKQRNPSPLFGFTVMDGGFFSIYPYNPAENIYSLTDVRLTPILKSESYNVVNTYKDFLSTCKESIKIIKSKFESNVTKYLPNFDNDFEYVDYYLSFKTKSKATHTDDRSLIHYNDPQYPNIHRFCGGKLTGIFSMDEILTHLIQP